MQTWIHEGPFAFTYEERALLRVVFCNVQELDCSVRNLLIGQRPIAQMRIHLLHAGQVKLTPVLDIASDDLTRSAMAAREGWHAVYARIMFGGTFRNIC